MQDRFLEEAEALESAASSERVSYLQAQRIGGLVLDVGCGNGYAVAEWRRRGIRAVGVDSSFHRLGRWIGQHSARPYVLADAMALPFRAEQFDSTYSSGLIEHVGVSEQGGSEYHVAALPAKHEMRRQAVGEMCRVTKRSGSVILDFPNGMFPIDFWHGTSLASFRLHSLPDLLNPTIWEIERYVPNRSVTALPLGNRLGFRQISQRWWGRALRGPAALFVRFLDALPRGLRPVHGLLYPFLVVRIGNPRQSS